MTTRNFRVNLKDLQKKDFYEKPTTQRKRKKAAAVARWAKKVRDQQLPKKCIELIC